MAEEQTFARVAWNLHDLDDWIGIDGLLPNGQSALEWLEQNEGDISDACIAGGWGYIEEMLGQRVIEMDEEVEEVKAKNIYEEKAMSLGFKPGTPQFDVCVEVHRVYADCWKGGPALRNLDFAASYPVSRDDAYKIMGSAVEGGYNDFDFRLLNHIEDDAEIVIARESSPCIYLKGAPNRLRKLKADECFNYYNVKFATNETLQKFRYRIWWD